MTTLTLRDCIDAAIRGESVEPIGCDRFRIVVRSWYQDRAKSIEQGPAVLVTDRPEAIVTGPACEERGRDDRQDTRWVECVREVRIGEIGAGFVALRTTRRSSGCDYSGGELLLPLVGQPPELSFGGAYQAWCADVEPDARHFLVSLASSRRVRRMVEFAAGAAHAFAPHAQRRNAWRCALRALGARGHLDSVVRSVRTATTKSAIRLGWQPPVPQPTFWAGLPRGVVAVPLEDRTDA